MDAENIHGLSVVHLRVFHPHPHPRLNLSLADWRNHTTSSALLRKRSFLVPSIPIRFSLSLSSVSSFVGTYIHTVSQSVIMSALVYPRKQVITPPASNRLVIQPALPSGSRTGLFFIINTPCRPTAPRQKHLHLFFLLYPSPLAFVFIAGSWRRILATARYRIFSPLFFFCNPHHLDTGLEISRWCYRSYRPEFLRKLSIIAIMIMVHDRHASRTSTLRPRTLYARDTNTNSSILRCLFDEQLDRSPLVHWQAMGQHSCTSCNLLELQDRSLSDVAICIRSVLKQYYNLRGCTT